MPITTISAREFNQDTARAKRATANGPVFITDRGEPSYVLLNLADYQRLTQTPSPANETSSLAELLALPGSEDFDFDPPRSRELPRAADFS